jgi:hypothetical protein
VPAPVARAMTFRSGRPPTGADQPGFRGERLTANRFGSGPTPAATPKFGGLTRLAQSTLEEEAACHDEPQDHAPSSPPTGHRHCHGAADWSLCRNGYLSGPSRRSAGRSCGGTAALRRGRCATRVQHPHKSTHVPGNVNVVVTLFCTAQVPQINIRAALYRNGSLVRDSGQKSVYNVSYAAHNAATPCVSGWYQGWMSYSVLFPPGYSPPTGASSGFGNSVYITC